MRPLSNLTRKDAVWNWTPACQLAFEGVKQALTEAPVLAQPDFSADAPGFDVWCDASDFGTGAVLLQGGRVIAFDASSFHDAQRRYTTDEKELLAVVRALSTWRCYLEGVKAVKVMHRILICRRNLTSPAVKHVGVSSCNGSIRSLGTTSRARLTLQIQSADRRRS